MRGAELFALSAFAALMIMGAIALGMWAQSRLERLQEKCPAGAILVVAVGDHDPVCAWVAQ